MNQPTIILSCACHNLELKNPAIAGFKNCFTWFLDYVKKSNLHPTHIGLDGKNYSNNKIVPFEKGQKKLLDNKFNNLLSMSIYVSKADTEDFAFYWDMLFSFSCSPILGTTLYIGIDVNLLDLNGKIIKELSSYLCQLMDIDIGYFYLTSPEEGPFAYSLGAIHTPESNFLSEDKKDMILAWFRDNDLVKYGKFRDLYQYNILSTHQLNYQIDEETLRNWISLDPERGTLFSLSPNHSLWEVPTKNYQKLREQLNLFEVLIAYDEYSTPTMLIEI